MRVTELGLALTASSVIEADLSRIADLNREVASGQRVTQPSDDPAASALLLANAEQLALNAQGERTSQLMQNRIDQEVQTLQSVAGFLQQARTLIVEGQNGTLTPSDRQALAAQMQGILGSVLGLANTATTDRPLFSGTSGQTPFVQSGGVISYQGDQGTFTASLSPGTSIVVHEPGTRIFLAQTDTATGTPQPSGPLGLSGSFTVNGATVTVAATNTLADIAAAINGSGAGVLATVTPANALVISSLSTAPLRLADTAGTVLVALGILTPTGAIATETLPDNLFDALLGAAQDLQTNTVSDLPARLLELDRAASTLGAQEAFLGSQAVLAQATGSRLRLQDAALAETSATFAGADAASVYTDYQSAVAAYHAAVAAAVEAVRLGTVPLI